MKTRTLAGPSTRSRSTHSPQPAKKVRHYRPPCTSKSPSRKARIAVSKIRTSGTSVVDAKRSDELATARKRRNNDASDVLGMKRRANSEHSVSLPPKSGPSKVGGVRKDDVRGTSTAATPSMNHPAEGQQRPNKVGMTQKQTKAAMAKRQGPQPPLEDRVRKYYCCFEYCRFTAPTQELIAHIRQEHGCIKHAILCQRCHKIFEHLFGFLCHLNPKCEAVERTAATVNQTNFSPKQQGPNSSHGEAATNIARQQNYEGASEKTNTLACQEKSGIPDKVKREATTATSPSSEEKSQTPKCHKTATGEPVCTTERVCEDAGSEVKCEISNACETRVDSQQLQVLQNRIHPFKGRSANRLALVWNSVASATHHSMLFPQCVAVFLHNGQYTKVLAYSHPFLEVQRIMLPEMGNRNAAFFSRHPHALYKKLSVLFDPFKHAGLSLLLCRLCDKHRRLPKEVVRAFERYFRIVSSRGKARSVPDTYANVTLFCGVPTILPPGSVSASYKTVCITVPQNATLRGLSVTLFPDSPSSEVLPSMSESQEVTAAVSSGATSGPSLLVRCPPAAQKGACLDSVQSQSPIVSSSFIKAASCHSPLRQLYTVPSLAPHGLTLGSCSIRPALESDMGKAHPLTNVMAPPSLVQIETASCGFEKRSMAVAVPVSGYLFVPLPQVAAEPLLRHLAPQNARLPLEPPSPNGILAPAIHNPSHTQGMSKMPTTCAANGTSSQVRHPQPVLPTKIVPGQDGAQPIAANKARESSCRPQMLVPEEALQNPTPVQLKASATVSSSTLLQVACPVSAFPSNSEPNRDNPQPPHASNKALRNPRSMPKIPPASVSSGASPQVFCPVPASNKEPNRGCPQPHAANNALENNRTQQMQVPGEVLTSPVPTQQTLCTVVSCCTSPQSPCPMPALVSHFVSNRDSAQPHAGNKAQGNDSTPQLHSSLYQMPHSVPYRENARLQTTHLLPRVTYRRAQNHALMGAPRNLISAHQTSSASISALCPEPRIVSGCSLSLAPNQGSTQPQFSNNATRNTSRPQVCIQAEVPRKPSPVRQMPPVSVSSSNLLHKPCPISVLPSNLPLSPVCVPQQAAKTAICKPSILRIRRKSYVKGALQSACPEEGRGLYRINLKSALGRLMLSGGTLPDSEEQNDYVCDCGFRAGGQDSIEKHMTHLHVVPFSRECKLCGKRMVNGKDQRSHFGEHMRRTPRLEKEISMAMETDDASETESAALSPELSVDKPADYSPPNPRASPLEVEEPVSESTKHDTNTPALPLVQPTVGSGVFEIHSMLVPHTNSECFEAVMVPDPCTSLGEQETPSVPNICASLVESRVVASRPSQASLSKANKGPVVSTCDADSSGSPESPQQMPGEDFSFQKLRPDLAGTIAMKPFFKCIVKACTFTADSPSSYSAHLAFHTLKELDLLCIYCGQRLEAIALLVQHMVHAHGQRRHQCGWCLYRCVDPFYRRLHHSLDHVGKKPLFFKCDNSELEAPEQVFPSQQVGLTHYWCHVPSCNFKSTSPDQFEWHLNEEHPRSKTYSCFTCELSVDTPRELVKHCVEHNMDLVQCAYCHHSEPSYRKMLKHATQYHQDYKLKLFFRTREHNLLFNKFVENCRLRPALHERQEQPVVEMEESRALPTKLVSLKRCPYCNRGVVTLSEILQHCAETHRLHVPCSEILNAMLKELPQAQSAASEFRCPFCSFAANRQTDLEAHLYEEFQYSPVNWAIANKLHEEERHKGMGRLTVPSVDQDFEEWVSSFVSRQEVERPPAFERPFSCDSCAGRFEKVSELRVHIYAHKNYFPHHCGCCEEPFASVGDVQVHLQRQHNIADNFLIEEVRHEEVERSVDQSIETQLSKLESLIENASTETCLWMGCEYSSANREDLVCHMKRTHLMSRQMCALCEYSSFCSSVIRWHTKTVHGAKPLPKEPPSTKAKLGEYRCGYCSFRASTSFAIREHSALAHPKKPVKMITPKRRLHDSHPRHSSTSSAPLQNFGVPTAPALPPSQTPSSGLANSAVSRQFVKCGFPCDQCKFQASSANLLQIHRSYGHPDPCATSRGRETGIRIIVEREEIAAVVNRILKIGSFFEKAQSGQGELKPVMTVTQPSGEGLSDQPAGTELLKLTVGTGAQAVENSQTFTCFRCQWICSSKAALDYHLAERHRYCAVCCICKKCFTNNALADGHIKKRVCSSNPSYRTLTCVKRKAQNPAIDNAVASTSQEGISCYNRPLKPIDTRNITVSSVGTSTGRGVTLTLDVFYKLQNANPVVVLKDCRKDN